MKTFSQMMEDVFGEAKSVGRDKQLSDREIHRGIISAHRKDNNRDQNREATQRMASRISELGYGYTRDHKGSWENANKEKEHEKSFVIHAKGPGLKHAQNLLHDMHKLRSEFNQDSFVHVLPNGKKRQAEAGYAFNRDGSRDKYGNKAVDTDNPYGETGYKRGGRKFTFT